MGICYFFLCFFPCSWRDLPFASKKECLIPGYFSVNCYFNEMESFTFFNEDTNLLEELKTKQNCLLNFILQEKELAPKQEKFDRAKLEDLLKRRFFFVPSFEIYGGRQVLGAYLYSSVSLFQTVILLCFYF